MFYQLSLAVESGDGPSLRAGFRVEGSPFGVQDLESRVRLGGQLSTFHVVGPSQTLHDT